MESTTSANEFPLLDDVNNPMPFGTASTTVPVDSLRTVETVNNFPQVNPIDCQIRTSLNVLNTPFIYSTPICSSSYCFADRSRGRFQSADVFDAARVCGMPATSNAKQGSTHEVAEVLKVHSNNACSFSGSCAHVPDVSNTSRGDSLLENELRLKEAEVECMRLRLKLLKRQDGPAIENADDNASASHQRISTLNNCSCQNESLDARQPLEDCLKSLVISANLPKIEIESFDGSPLRYHSFIRNFQLNIASKLINEEQKLSYLLHYCSGRAKAAIQHCVLLPYNEGYCQALEILKRQFGRPHEIIQAVTKDLFNGPRISLCDIEGLQSLATHMKSCQLTLSQLSHPSELNCSTNLLRIVDRLPRPMQEKWAEVADTVINLGREPSFEDLLGFIEKRISVSSNLYGQLISHPKPEHYTRYVHGRDHLDSQKARRHSHVSAVVSTAPTPRECDVCQGAHDLDKCDRFIRMSLTERRVVLKANKRCFQCMMPNHMARYCKVRVQCSLPECGGRHHTLMHVEPGSASQVLNGGTTVEDRKVCLGCVPVKLIGKDGSVDTYAFLDNGSDTTLIEASLAKRLGIPKSKCKLNIRTLHGSKTVDSYELSLKVQSLEDGTTVDVDKAFTVDSLPVDRARVVTEDDMLRWPHLAGISFESLRDNKVGILIGCDVPEAHWVTEQKAGRKGEPYAVKSSLGWALRGPTSLSSNHRAEVNFIKGDELRRIVQDMYELEFNDHHLSHERGHSVEDQRAMSMVESSATLKDGKYEICLPWRSDNVDLPDNRWLAHRRLMLLRKRLVKDPELRQKYSDVLLLHLARGYVRKIDEFDKTSRRWYLPHHPVLNPNKPGKVRIVFDCAASFEGTSLNKSLLQGPLMTNNLVGVLLRFRKGLIALSSDIEEMFLQVRVPATDRWALSFLWWNDESMTGAPDVYEIMVHPFGATSSPFCATYALRKTAIDNSTSFALSTADVVRENFYVDDCLVSVDTLESARRLTSELRQMLLLGGFRLVKWVSNVPEALVDVPQDERVATPVALDLNNGSHQRALGVQWHLADDSFRFQVKLPNRSPTRRGLLACVASVYDPLGFISPLVLYGRRLLQELCSNGVGWDTPLEERHMKAWDKWSYAIRKADQIVVPRCIRPHGQQPIRSELHMFSDASETGYGAVGYLRDILGDGRIVCSFLMGKSRVAPLKTVTIPRLELTAAVLAARLMQLLTVELRFHIDRVTLWTDSAIVLEYIGNTSCRFATFVANRVQLIREYTQGCQWRHVPSELNPADVASRGSSEACSSDMAVWLNGPAFLRDSEDTWPTESVSHETVKYDLELKRVFTVTTIVREPWFERLTSRYSRWQDLLRAVAWLVRFKSYFICMKVGRQDRSIRLGPLRKTELDEACKSIVRAEQRIAFGKDYATFNKRRTNTLARLKPVICDGILCLGGRVRCSTSQSIGLMILPSHGPVTDLIIRHYHEIEGHSGGCHVLASIRRKFWIVKGMASVRRVLTRCIKCRMLSARPCQQIMAPLPEDRTIAGGAPFTACGVDYFGPFEVRIGRSTYKRYGCLFTCLRTRAIHIEVAHSLSTDSFLMALMRFISRRGVPEVLYSDNGSNFVGADIELKRTLVGFDQERIQRTLLNRGIDWHFNPPSASHWGGIWERMIRTVRRVMQAVVREQVMSDEALHTYMLEAERIVNDRPLVPVYDDPDCPSALRPSDLLLLSRRHSMLCRNVSLLERYTKGWRQAQHLASMFWRRWVREYLPSIQVRHKWTKTERDVRVGDLVLVIGTSKPVGVWPKAVVSEVVKGTDGHVREVILKTSGGLMRRDIRSICLLEGCTDNRVDEPEI